MPDQNLCYFLLIADQYIRTLNFTEATTLSHAVKALVNLYVQRNPESDCVEQIVDEQLEPQERVFDLIRAMDQRFQVVFEDHMNKTNIASTLYRDLARFKPSTMCENCFNIILKLYLKIRLFYTLQNLNYQVKSNQKNIYILPLSTN